MKASRLPQEAGKHGFYAPLPWEGRMQGVQTFSVGVFEMVPTKDGKKLKRGPAKVRVHGSVGHYDLVIQKCHAIASLLDAGAYTEGKKTWV